MDIIGAVFFELMIICMLCRRSSKKQQQTDVATLYGQAVGSRMLWIYLILLNIWILASTLLVFGILWHKSQLLLFWLFWCLGGLIFDVVFVLWWLWEMISGDAIEALTNILISMLTMSIEFGFIYVVYNVYMNLSQSPVGQSNNDSLLSFANFIF
ncbi:uncharacterized protein LOC117787664 [Drosophila innubila]|uniref:uncharacterized protein LOC117787664 n=1 Tax=Drosophila innubila TaxID=198719 RepID=UPI00148CC662|nr:uncharacterized protein LOC117787664 [Drosophila innubila]